MKNFTLGQAAKATGRAKGTITNAIKKGRLTAEKNEIGQYEIQPAELFRVFPEQSNNSQKLNKTDAVAPVQNREIMADLAVELGKTKAENEALEKQIDLLREMLTKSEQTVERERANTEEWRKQAQTLALTDQRAKGGWWPFKRSA